MADKKGLLTRCHLCGSATTTLHKYGTRKTVIATRKELNDVLEKYFKTHTDQELIEMILIQMDFEDKNNG